MNEVVTINPGTGEVEKYTDLFAAVTPEMVTEAESLERDILHQNANIQISYFNLAKALADFKQRKLYLARGEATFKDWADSENLKGLGSRTAYNLVRIAEEALPIFEKNNISVIPGLSTLYDMLPILNDDDAEAKFVKAAKEVIGLPTRGAKDAIKEIRGINTVPEAQPALFKGVAKITGDYIRLDIWCSTGDDYYQVNERGPLMVRREDWPRMEGMFRGYVEVTTQED